MCLELEEHHKIGFYTATRFYEGEENVFTFYHAIWNTLGRWRIVGENTNNGGIN